jgi:heptosyltransferase III
MTVRRVLIYRLGSLGDTVVALPCLNLIARAFPEAERRVLTNFPTVGKAPPVSQVLGESGLAHGYIRYPVGTRSPAALFRLRREIAAFAPDMLVYLTESRGRGATWRDVAFFRTCGIPRIVGAPMTEDLSTARYLPRRGQWEYEAERLARCVAELGDVALDRRASWDLHFTPAERARAAAETAGWDGPSIAFSIGTKIDTKDWGDANWRAVLNGLAANDTRLVLIGADEEAERSAAVAASWPGPVLNLCGRLSPRESALAIAQVRLYMGHDSGPMHLAAAVDVPVVAVFSARLRPGVWFPYGPKHTVLYHKTPCFDCHLERCVELKKYCITSITPESVIAAAKARLL